jgi:hypothetical protein
MHVLRRPVEIAVGNLPFLVIFSLIVAMVGED